jgi:broad specificity phosphatase PhoE
MRAMERRRPGAPMPTTFFLARHAAHERLGRTLLGRAPESGLSHEGRLQAARLAERLAGERITLIQTSPLPRALQTAARIASHLGLAAEPVEALSEVDYGEWSGLDFTALDRDPRWPAWLEARHEARPPGGEILAEVQARAVAHVQRLARAHPDGRVLLVSHGDVIKALLLHAFGLDLAAVDRIEVGPASLSAIVLGEGFAQVLLVSEEV